MNRSWPGVMRTRQPLSDLPQLREDRLKITLRKSFERDQKKIKEKLLGYCFDERGSQLLSRGSLFNERLVQQFLDVGLILGHSLTAGELPCKLHVSDRKPYAHLFGRRFQDVGST